MFIFNGHTFDFSTSSIPDMNRFKKANQDWQRRMATRKTAGLMALYNDLRRVVIEIFNDSEAADRVFGNTQDVGIMLEAYIALVKAIPLDAQARAATLVAQANAATEALTDGTSIEDEPPV